MTMSNKTTDGTEVENTRIGDYEVTINLHCLPAEDIEAAKLEIWDILRALNQLPYDFDVHFKKVGEWL